MPPAIARIIDANFNRAREALRVMEDYARFVLDDPAGCEAIKRLRHDLAGCMRRLPAEALLAGRDTPGDVGTTVSTDSERRRSDAAEVFTAAAKRLPEALRTIEEYAKTISPELSIAVEALRYRAYDLEQRIALRGHRADRFARTRLYVLVTESLCVEPAVSPPGREAAPSERETAPPGGRASCPPSNPEASEPEAPAREPGASDEPFSSSLACASGSSSLACASGSEALGSGRPRPAWLEIVLRAIAGGADCIQLREKSFEDGELLARARLLAELCRRHNVLFIMNDRPDLAVLADADGVHLGQTDMPIRDARRIVGPDRLIGVSTHTPEQLRAAIAAGPDYIAVGPMFASSTKPQDHTPGPELLALAVRETEIPIVPIGGITSANAGILVQAGARRLCVCSAVIGAGDPEAAARQLVSLLQAASSAGERGVL